ncbi:truncated transcription factor CAULIFLOWER A-like protein [Tanacetum coccineum]
MQEKQKCGSWTLESSKLRAKIEVLEKNIKHYVGEDLEPLSLRELQSVEQQLETALKRIRTRKNQVMRESISDLYKKERALQEQNNTLSKKLKENDKNIEQQNAGFLLPTPQPQLPPPQPPGSLARLVIGSGSFQGATTIREDDPAQTHTMSATMMPPWLLRHMSQ